MSSYYPTTPAYAAVRYGGRYTPAPTVLQVVEPTIVARAGDNLTELIGVHPSWLPRREQGVAPQSDLAMMMLQEKADLGKITVGSLVYQIIQREQMKETNLLRIAYQEVAIDGEILHLEGAWAPDKIPMDNRTKAGLEAELIRMQQQKRAEEVECWRDISRLKEKLLESLGLYRDSARRERMVASSLPAAGTTWERG